MSASPSGCGERSRCGVFVGAHSMQPIFRRTAERGRHEEESLEILAGRLEASILSFHHRVSMQKWRWIRVARHQMPLLGSA